MSNRRLVPLNVVSLPTAPSGVARAGDLYHNSTDGNLYVSDGTAWTALGGADGPYGSGDFDYDFSRKTTDDLTEGSTNKYFTAQRALTATQGAYDAYGSAVAAEVAANLYTDQAIAGFDALPTQTGNAGKFLSTNGTTTSWQTVSTVSSQFLVQSSAPASPTMGAVYFNSTTRSLLVFDGNDWISAGAIYGSVIDGGNSRTSYQPTSLLDGGVSSSTY